MMLSLAAYLFFAAQEAAAETEAAKWPATAFFGLHYDLHPGAGDTELGRETTYEHIREQLEKVEPDYEQYDCKGHPVTRAIPQGRFAVAGIVNDALRSGARSPRYGYSLSIHYSGVWTPAPSTAPRMANVHAAVRKIKTIRAP